MTFVSSWMQRVFGRRPPRRRSRRGRSPAAASNVVEQCEDRVLLTLDIVIDYTYDSNNFFTPQSRRDVIEEVAAIYEARITDDLTAITPGGVNSWTAIFNDPSTGSSVSLGNPAIPANKVIVYVGARPQPGRLALGGHGGFSASATPQFIENLKTRGEAGVDPNGDADTDYALWGGTISFNSDTNWNSTFNPPLPNQNDLFTVALHEMGHVLGFGTSQSFLNLVNPSNEFIGSEAVAAAGGPVPMHSDGKHYASGTMGVLPGTSTTQENNYDPQILVGTRKHLTNVDWAAIDDLGWDVTAVVGPTDYGDAPDATAGEGSGNYRTRAAEGGPGHSVIAGLMIGDSVDGDDGENQDTDASADDLTGTDDEDFSGSDNLVFIEGVATSVDVNVTNTTPSAATLYGWVDFNNDGVFAGGTESASVTVPAGTNNGTVTLTFPAPAVGTAGATFARFRLSSDASAASPGGLAVGGEVEDHAATILTQSTAYDPLPLFTWPPVAGAFRYELEVNNLTTGEDQFILQSELTGTSFRPHQALPPGHFEWRVRAHNGVTWLPFNTPATLNIFATAGNPFITDPVTSSVDSLPTFAWSHVESATRYELWVNQTGRPLVIHDTNVKTASWTPNDGLDSGTYTAWVRAFNGQTVLGTWSPAFIFTLSQSHSSVLTDPVAGQRNTTPTFGWLPTVYPGYTLRIDNLSTGAQNVVVAQNLSGTSYQLPEGLPPGNYSATIQAVGTAESGAVPFQVLSTTGQAELTSPIAASANPLPVFSWTSVAGAVRYELWVDDVTNGVSAFLHDATLTGTAWPAQKPLLPGLYRAWVRAFGSAGPLGTWSTAVDFRVRESVGVPVIHSPQGTTDHASPLFVWSTVMDAAHYTVAFGYGPTGGTGVLPLTQQNVTGNRLQLDSAFEPGDYEATVTAHNSSGSALGSFTRRFVVAPTSGSPRAYSPVGNEQSPRPVWTWSAVSGASRYILWVNDVTRNINAFILQNNLTSPIYLPNDTLAAGDYRFWIRAYNGSSPVSGWSPATDFTITESSAPPRITAPLNNTINSVPTITWNHITGAASYDVEIIDTAAGPTPIVSDSTADTSFRPGQALTPGIYEARVRSVDSGGTLSPWSSLTLTIEAAATATLFNPLAGVSIATADLFFAWSTVATAARYELWVNNLTSGQIKIVHETTIAANAFTPAAQLPVGEYRAWVRGIAADDTPTAWSSGVDFSVVSNESANDGTDDGTSLTVSLRPQRKPAERLMLTATRHAQNHAVTYDNAGDRTVRPPHRVDESRDNESHVDESRDDRETRPVSRSSPQAEFLKHGFPAVAQQAEDHAQESAKHAPRVDEVTD